MSKQDSTADEQPLDLSQYADDASKVFDQEAMKVAQQVDQLLVISLVGNVNAGKSATINALTGKHYADVKPVAGWTKEVSLFPLPGFPMVRVADTPGLEDVDESVSARTEDFVEKTADVILFFVNASVGVTRPERQAYLRLVRAGRPVIPVINKIDLIEEEERQIVLDDVRAKLELSPSAPLFPVSAKKGLGILELIEGIAALLEKSGKDLLFAKVVRQKDPIVERWISRTSAAAFGLGIAPIPGSDTIPLTALQVGLCIKIATIYDHPVTREDVMPLITQVAASQVGKAVFRSILKAAGWMFGPPGAFITSSIAGVVAGAMTYGIGTAAQSWYQSNMTMSLPELRQVFQMGSDKYRSFKTLGTAR